MMPRVRALALVLVTFVVMSLFGMSALAWHLRPFLLSVDVKHFDRIVIGGGAGGSYAAVRLTDKGYHTALLEVTNRLGGHCNSVNVSAEAGWNPLNPAVVDFGVVAYPDTAVINNTYGVFAIDSRAFVERFANTTTLGPDGISPYFVADLDNKLGVSFAGFPNITGDDVLNLANALIANFSFLSTTTNPSSVPDELNKTIKEYMVANPQLVNFTRYFESLAEQGGFDVSTVSVFYLFREAPMYFAQAVEGGKLFRITNGCQALYDGMFNFLQASGTSKVFLNADIMHVTMPHSGSSGRHTVRFRVDGKETVITADHLVWGVSPTLANFAAVGMALDDVETAALAPVKEHSGYYAMRLNTADPLLPVALVLDVNNTENLNQPSRAGLRIVYQGIFVLLSCLVVSLVFHLVIFSLFAFLVIVGDQFFPFYVMLFSVVAMLAFSPIAFAAFCFMVCVFLLVCFPSVFFSLGATLTPLFSLLFYSFYVSLTVLLFYGYL